MIAVAGEYRQSILKGTLSCGGHSGTGLGWTKVIFLVPVTCVPESRVSLSGIYFILDKNFNVVQYQFTG